MTRDELEAAVLNAQDQLKRTDKERRLAVPKGLGAMLLDTLGFSEEAAELLRK